MGFGAFGVDAKVEARVRLHLAHLKAELVAQRRVLRATKRGSRGSIGLVILHKDVSQGGFGRAIYL